MPTYCAVTSCNKNSRSNPKLSFYQFPKDPEKFPSDPHMLNKWILATGKLNWAPRKHDTICSDHFDGECFIMTNCTHLSPDAMPTLKLHPIFNEGSQAASSGDNQGQKKVAEVLDGKVLIFRVYSYLRHEYEELKAYTGNSCDLSPLANILKRTSGATGVSEHIIARILDEKKRSGQFQDEVPEKRAKLSHEAENSGVSPTEETSSSVTTDNVQQADVVGQQEQEAYEIKSLKMEVDEEAIQYNRSARCDTEEKTPSVNPPQSSAIEHNQRERCDTEKENTWVSPQQSSREPSSADPQMTYTVTRAEVKVEPPDDDYQPSSTAAHHVTTTETHMRVKNEPADEIKDNPYMNATDNVNNNATRAAIKSEPPDTQTY